MLINPDWAGNFSVLRIPGEGKILFL